jgi:hypothetical protein
VVVSAEFSDVKQPTIFVAIFFILQDVSSFSESDISCLHTPDKVSGKSFLGGRAAGAVS